MLQRFLLQGPGLRVTLHCSATRVTQALRRLATGTTVGEDETMSSALEAEHARIRRTVAWSFGIFVAAAVAPAWSPALAGIIERHWPFLVPLAVGYWVAVLWIHHQNERIHWLEERHMKLAAAVHLLASAHVDDELHNAVMGELFKTTGAREVDQESQRIAKALHLWMFPY